MLIRSQIRKLRIISFLLFFTPVLALLGSLIIHNYLVSFKFEHEEKFNFEKNVPGEMIKILCNKENNFCENILVKKANKLNECNKYKLDVKFISENEKTFYQIQITNQLNEKCIINTDSIKYYNFAPFIFEKIYHLVNDKKKTTLGTTNPVNPILYGESSISNIVKRYPIKIIFKPLMYISVIFMIIYWVYYNLILNKLLNKQKINIFLVFGVLSAIFLLLHVIFLGWTFENEILTKLRKSYIVFFILFEVLAQAFLIKEIFKKKSEMSEYINNIVVYTKLGFVSLICFSTSIILIILVFYNLDPRIDYILEWNYFLLLLFFYFLSFIMWKKKF